MQSTTRACMGRCPAARGLKRCTVTGYHISYQRTFIPCIKNIAIDHRSLIIIDVLYFGIFSISKLLYIPSVDYMIQVLTEGQVCHCYYTSTLIIAARSVSARGMSTYTLCAAQRDRRGPDERTSRKYYQEHYCIMYCSLDTHQV